MRTRVTVQGARSTRGPETPWAPTTAWEAPAAHDRLPRPRPVTRLKEMIREGRSHAGIILSDQRPVGVRRRRLSTLCFQLAPRPQDAEAWGKAGF